MAARMTRRALVGGGAVAAVGVGAGVASGVLPGRSRLRADVKDRYHDWFGPHADIPSAPEGQIRLEQVHSRARGKTVDLFTAVPHGHGDGAGLPVCVVLHGVSATPKDYQSFGLGRFLTASVRAGAPPFVLAGADGGILYWEPDPAGGDDPQRMMTDEMPRWLHARGFDASRIAALGMVDGRLRRAAAGRGAAGMAAGGGRVQPRRHPQLPRRHGRRRLPYDAARGLVRPQRPAVRGRARRSSPSCRGARRCSPTATAPIRAPTGTASPCPRSRSWARSWDGRRQRR